MGGNKEHAIQAKTRDGLACIFSFESGFKSGFARKMTYSTGGKTRANFDVYI